MLFLDRPFFRPKHKRNYLYIYIFLIGLDLWVVGSDEINAEKRAVELLQKRGYPKDTLFELTKVM